MDRRHREVMVEVPEGTRSGPTEAEATIGSMAHAGSRFPCIDGVRAIAALAVIAFHSVSRTRPTWRTIGGRWLVHLNIGVWIFFVLSGFLLYLPFARAHLRARPAGSLRNYAVRRVARIYPAYWVALAFWMLVLPKTSISGRGGPLAYLTLTQGYFSVSLLGGIPVAWSLVTEISFYIFLPVYAFVIGSFARRARSPLTVELIGVGALVAIGYASLVVYVSTSTPPWFSVLPVRIQVFAVGMLLAILVGMPWAGRGREMLERIGRRSWIWWSLAAMTFLSIPLVIGVSPGRVASELQQVGGDICRTLVGLFLVLPVVLGPQDHGLIRRALRARVPVFLGLVSYGLYLWHPFILDTIRSDWLHGSWIQTNSIVLLAVALPVIVLAAAASWYIVEAPVQRASRRLTARAL